MFRFRKSCGYSSEASKTEQPLLNRIVRVNVEMMRKRFRPGTRFLAGTAFAALTLGLVCLAAGAQTAAPTAPPPSPSAPASAPKPAPTSTPVSAPEAQSPAPAQPGTSAPPSGAGADGAVGATPGGLPTQDQPVQTIITRVREVNLIFTVTDKKGHFITGLS